MNNVRIVFAALSVVILGIVFTACSEDKDTKFSIDNFTVTAVKGSNGSYVPASSSMKASDIIFILRVTNPISGTAPATSKETITYFTITSDSTLYSSVGDIAPNEDLTSYFQASDEINGTKIYDWDHQFAPVFGVSKKQKHNFKFTIKLDDGRSFMVQPGFYELLPQ